MWNESDLIECANMDGVRELLELSRHIDAEEPICAFRRAYCLARLAGWPPVAAIRVAMKNITAILDAGNKPAHLSVVK